jgi:hypothetical protein
MQKFCQSVSPLRGTQPPHSEAGHSDGQRRTGKAVSWVSRVQGGGFSVLGGQVPDLGCSCLIPATLRAYALPTLQRQVKEKSCSCLYPFPVVPHSCHPHVPFPYPHMRACAHTHVHTRIFMPVHTCAQYTPTHRHVCIHMHTHTHHLRTHCGLLV